MEQRSGGAFLVSLAAHAAMAILVVVATRATKASHPDTTTASETTAVRMVWLNKPGPSGGGGGGGNGMKEPPRRAELPGHDARTVPAKHSLKAQVSTLSTPAPPDREPAPEVVIPVETLALGTQVLPGAMDALPAPPTNSQGSGRDGGAGAGVGTGDGPGRGRGLGDGPDAGTGGDIYRPGAGVTMPIEIRKGMAQYTTEAIHARAQGAITVECVVQPSGVCTNIRVVHAFNPTFGLDQEAIKAAAQWKFRPGTRGGRPVPVLVTMEIAFALR